MVAGGAGRASLLLTLRARVAWFVASLPAFLRFVAAHRLRLVLFALQTKTNRPPEAVRGRLNFREEVNIQAKKEKLASEPGQFGGCASEAKRQLKPHRLQPQTKKREGEARGVSRRRAPRPTKWEAPERSRTVG